MCYTVIERLAGHWKPDSGTWPLQSYAEAADIEMTDICPSF